MPQLTPATKLDLRQDDPRWCGNVGRSVYPNESIGIDKSTLTSTFTNGFIPSGVVLGRLTATGLYGLYGGAADEVQSLVATGATAGTFTLSFDGETTAAIAWDATAAAVQAALLLLSNLNAGDVVATGGPLPATPVVLSFGGQYTGVNVPAITGASGSLTGGTATITTTTAGGSGGAGGLEAAAGLLYAAVPYGVNNAAGDDLIGALFVGGTVYEQFLPRAEGATGGLDDAARAALTHINFVPAP